MTSEVGMLFPPKVRLLVRLIVRLPGGVVITTGDQPVPAAGFDAAQAAGATTAPQV
jgi:hypothetical protein